MQPRHLWGLALTAALLTGCGGGGSSSDDSALGFLKDIIPPSPSEVAGDLFNPYDPDRRRQAINLFANSSFGGEEAYMKVYRTHATPGSADEDPTVRAAALRALARHGGPEDVKIITPWLNPKQPRFVRLEAATALQRLHEPSAVAPLIATLREDEAADVRATAANALAQYPEPRVFQTLVGALNDEDYSVVTQSVASLELLTGRQYGEDGSLWLAWADRTDNLFAGGGTYYYPQYVRPASIWDKAQFWKDRPKADPQQPRSTSTPSGDGEPKG